jgi:hypothetical protein
MLAVKNRRLINLDVEVCDRMLFGKNNSMVKIGDQIQPRRSLPVPMYRAYRT